MPRSKGKGKGKGTAGKQAGKGKAAMPEFIAAAMERNKVIVEVYGKATAFSVTFDPLEDKEIITGSAMLTDELRELLQVMIVSGIRSPIRHDSMIGYPSEELWKTARKIILLKNGKPMTLRQLPKSTEPAQVSIKIRLLKPHTSNPNEYIRGFNSTIASAADIEQPAATKPVNGKRKLSATQDAKTQNAETQVTEKKHRGKAMAKAAQAESDLAATQVAVGGDRPSHKELKQAARKLPPAEQVKHLYTNVADMASMDEAGPSTDGSKGKLRKRAPSSAEAGPVAAAGSPADDASAPSFVSPRLTRSGTVFGQQSTGSDAGSKAGSSMPAAKLSYKTPIRKLSENSTSTQSLASTWEDNDENGMEVEQKGENLVEGEEEAPEQPDTPISPPLTRSQQVYELVTSPIKAVGRMLGY